MRIKSEWELLGKISNLINKDGFRPSEDLLQPIGDDCAVFRISGSRVGLITTDISIESVHFRRDISSYHDIGFKAMMGNISDITAMGGKPKFAFISLGLPAGFREEDALAMYKGLTRAGNTAGVVIAGGDTSKSKEIIINIALYGEAKEKKIIKRNGANAGNIIYVTGDLGASLAGLEILLSKKKNILKKYSYLVNKHKRPLARFTVIDEIITKFRPTSMIDISDGLLSDLRHICEASGTGFQITEESLPVHNNLRKYCSQFNKNTSEYTLKSGEEYEILFTSAKKIKTPVIIGKEKIPVTPIGRITDKGFSIIRDNTESKVRIEGFDHFQ